MKKILLILSIVVLMGCCAKQPETKQNVPTPHRIHVLEGSSLTLFMIIEVDGHQYLSRGDGGIVHLESCPCKK
jgi:uncharacterized lipoprotein YajG